MRARHVLRRGLRLRGKLGRRGLRTVGQHDDLPAGGVRLRFPLRCPVPRAAAAAAATTRADAVLPHVQLRALLQDDAKPRLRGRRAIADATAGDGESAKCVRRLLHLHALRGRLVGLRG